MVTGKVVAQPGPGAEAHPCLNQKGEGNKVWLCEDIKLGPFPAQIG